MLRMNNTKQFGPGFTLGSFFFGSFKLPLFRQDKFCWLLYICSVVAGRVVNAEDYLYSSARNYIDMENVLDVIQVSIRWKTY